MFFEKYKFFQDTFFESMTWKNLYTLLCMYARWMGIVGCADVLKQTDFLRALIHLDKNGFLLMMRDYQSTSTPNCLP